MTASMMASPNAVKKNKKNMDIANDTYPKMDLSTGDVSAMDLSRFRTEVRVEVNAVNVA